MRQAALSLAIIALASPFLAAAPPRRRAGTGAEPADLGLGRRR